MSLNVHKYLYMLLIITAVPFNYLCSLYIVGIFWYMILLNGHLFHLCTECM